MNIAVTGAAGYIGGRLVKHLCEQDWVQKVVGTDIQVPAFNHPKYTFVRRDIRRPMEDLFESEQIQAVVHTAYILPPHHDKNFMEDINMGGTHNVLRASVKTGVKQILYTSSTTAYGFYPDNDQPLTEESPLRGNDDFTYAKNKKELEQIFRDFQIEHPDILVSIVRPCFVVGPGFTNVMAQHLQKKIVMVPAKTLPWQFVHEDDLICIMAMMLEQKIGGVFNVTGEGTMTFPEMIKMLGNIRLPLPWPIIYPLNHLAWLLRLSFITRFPSPPMRMMVYPWIADSKKLRDTLKYMFKYDTRSAFEDFVKSVKK